MITSHDEIQRTKLNELSHRVIGLCMEVHRELGPGLLESAYEEALAHELALAGLNFERQREMPLVYKGARLDCGYRLDFIVEKELIIELKAVQSLEPVHHAQLLTYLKLERRSLGLLINFNVPTLKDGIKRVVAGSLFKNEKRIRSDFGQLALFLCASALLWFRSRF
ncbi:GxxExxY protein [Opitutaceae bacterium TAV5]|nr:GxxExxY protein [Opitutaceae bacterium TAV5]